MHRSIGFAFTLIIFVRFFAPSMSYAAAVSDIGCETADLYASPDGVMLGLPIEDQDGTGLCYAYSSSTVMNHYLIKNRLFSGPVVHPIYTAFTTKKVEEEFAAGSAELKASAAPGSYPKTLDSARVFDAFRQTKRAGFCGASGINLRLMNLLKAGGFQDYAELLRFLDAHFEDKQSEFASGPTNKSQQAFKKIYAPDCNLQNANAWLRQRGLQDAMSTEILAKLFAGCEKFKPPLPSVSNTLYSTDTVIANEIRSKLKAGNPLTATIACFADFDDKPSTARSVSLHQSKSGPLIRGRRPCKGSDSSSHAVVIAGQKMMNNRCQILIRNSWGSTWKSQSATACACKTKDGRYKDACSKAEAKSFLGCWYSRDDVIGNLQETNAFN